MSRVVAVRTPRQVIHSVITKALAGHATGITRYNKTNLSGRRVAVSDRGTVRALQLSHVAITVTVHGDELTFRLLEGAYLVSIVVRENTLATKPVRCQDAIIIQVKF